MNLRRFFSRPLIGAFTFAMCFAGAHFSALAQTGPGYAISLNGSGQYVTVPSAAASALTGPFTVEAWVYVRAYADWSRLIDFATATGNNEIVCMLSGSTSGRPYLQCFNAAGGETGSISVPSPLPLNTWTHLAFTCDGATGRIFVNGILAVTGPVTVPSGSTRTSNFIGRSNWSGDADANAMIDELRIWNVARPAADILSNMVNTALSGSTPGLLAYWHFNDGTGTAASDATGHGYTGTLVNGPLWKQFPSLGPASAATATATTETLSGSVQTFGQSTTAAFVWSLDTSYNNSTPATGNTTDFPITATIGGLTPGATYHYLLIAENSVGQTYGPQQTFIAGALSVVTLPAAVSGTNAALHGTVTNLGSPASGWFQWGTTTSYGSNTAATSLGSGTGPVATSANITGLTPGILYHFRAVGSNAAGIFYGADQSFAAAVVTTLADSGPGSLRQAIADAGPGDFLFFAVTGTISLTGGEIVINRSVNIIGPGANDLAISGNQYRRLFNIGGGVTMTISGLTLRGGRAEPGTTSNPDGQDGGSIWNAGTLTMTNCVVSGNAGDSFGRINTFGDTRGNGGNGGAIYNAGVLTMKGCAVAGFSGIGGDPEHLGWSGGNGGGIYNIATLNAIECTFTNGFTGVGGGTNYMPSEFGRGGGIYNGGTFIATACIISGNGSSYYLYATYTGGGIYNSGNFVATGCTISGNNAYGGAGIYVSGGSLTLTACTVTSNNAFGSVFNSGAGISNAAAGSVSLRSTLVAGNSVSGRLDDLSGAFISQGHNLVGAVGASTGIANGVNADLAGSVASPLDAKLLPLGIYGGPTKTHALAPDSLAVDAGDDALLNAPFNLTADQRGFSRKVGAHVDIGSFEFNPAGSPLMSATTLGAVPSGTSSPVTGTGSAALNGSVNPGGIPGCGAYFQFGLNTGYGGVAAAPSPGSGINPVPLSAVASGLVSGFTYHYRVVETNPIGSVYGLDQSITVPSLYPAGDLNGDGLVSQSELNAILTNYWPSSPWLYMTNVTGLGGTNVTFALTNSTAGAFSVEYSTNLTNWQFLGPATPRYLFTDTNAPANPQRYYRLRYP